MVARGNGAIFLALAACAVSAQQVLTITQYPSVCSAIYTSGAQSVTVVQSTITATSTPFSDQSANSGTPFVLRIQVPATYGAPTKRQYQSHWLMENGNTTENGLHAAQYYINSGQLRTVSGGYVSTSGNVASQLLAVSYAPQSISTTFSVINDQLTWSNPSFAQNGTAQIFKVPYGAAASSEIIVSFQQNQPQQYTSWSPASLVARPVSEAVSNNNASQYFSVSTSIIMPGSFSSTSQAAQYTPSFSFAPQSSSAPYTGSSASPPVYSVSSIPGSSSTAAVYTSGSSTSSQSAPLFPTSALSTVTAPGTPIGPVHLSQPSSQNLGMYSQMGSISSLTTSLASQSSATISSSYISSTTSSIAFSVYQPQSSITTQSTFTSSSLVSSGSQSSPLPPVYTPPNTSATSSSLSSSSWSSPPVYAQSSSSAAPSSTSSPVPSIYTPPSVSTTSPLSTTAVSFSSSSNVLYSSSSIFSSTSSTSSLLFSSTGVSSPPIVYMQSSTSSSSSSISSLQSPPSYIQSSTTSSSSLTSTAAPPVSQQSSLSSSNLATSTPVSSSAGGYGVTSSSSSVGSTTTGVPSSSFSSTQSSNSAPPYYSAGQSSSTSANMGGNHMAGTGTTSSATATRTYNVPTYACPAVNGMTVNDNWNTSYIIGCGQDTTSGSYSSVAVSNSWDDCFWRCHNSSTTQGVGQCTAFTYSGGTNGVGAGTCFLKDIGSESFTGSGTNLVGAIQLAFYVPSSSSAIISSTASSTQVAAVYTSSAASSIRSSTITSAPISSLSSSVSSSVTTNSPSTSYLVLPSPTACNFGDPAGTNEDDSFCEIDLPFSMAMYSKSSPQTFASTNGFVSLTNGSQQYQVHQLPYFAIPNSTVAPLFDDLYIYGQASPTQGIFFQYNATAVTYEYYLARAGSPSAITHFTVGYSTASPGVFTYTYHNVGNGNNGNTSCIGVQGQNSAGTEVAVQFSYQAASVFPGTVVVCDTNAATCTRTQ